VVDVKTGQQVGTRFKVDADANGAFVKNRPMDLGEHPALESPCERRSEVRSWRRPSAASPPCKAEDAPDRTSQLLSLGLLLAASEFLVSSSRGTSGEDRYPAGCRRPTKSGVAELRADLGSPAGKVGVLPLRRR
jgi:hypothetical protein